MYGITNTEVFKKGKTVGRDWNSLLGKTILVNTSIGEYNFSVESIVNKNKIKEVYLKDLGTGYLLPPIYNDTLIKKDIAKVISKDKNIRKHVLNIENIKRSSKGICWEDNIGREFILKYKNQTKRFTLKNVISPNSKDIVLEFKQLKNKSLRKVCSASFNKGEFRELFRTETVGVRIEQSNYSIDYGSVENLTKEEIDSLPYGTDKKMKFICNSCNKLQSLYMTPRQIFNSGKNVERQCDFCGTVKSKGEFIMGNILNSLNISYIKEFGKNNCDWVEDCRYDFYVEKYNAIIEVHGVQHFKEDNIWYFRKDGRSNRYIDSVKRDLAFENGISKYYEIEWDNPSLMYKSIEDTNLNKEILIGLNREMFDKISTKNYMEELECICKEYNEVVSGGNTRLSSLSKRFKYSMPTIRKKLRIANNLGLISYSDNEVEEMNRISQRQFEYKVTNNMGEEKLFYNFKDITLYCGMGRSLIQTMIKEATPYKSFSKRYSHYNGYTIQKSVIKQN